MTANDCKAALMVDQQNKNAYPEDNIKGERQIGVNDFGRTFALTLDVGKE
jgi:hypothetical protein